MFGFFKKKSTALPNPNELKKLSAQAREDVKNKWNYFIQTVPFKSDTPLSKKIDLFLPPIQEFIEANYSILLTLLGPEFFWLTVVTGILESGTHPADEVNAAVEKLGEKYATG